VRYLRQFATTVAATRKLVAKLAARQPLFCFEAGPTGSGLYRLNREPRRVAVGPHNLRLRNPVTARIVIHEAQSQLRGRREHLPVSEFDDGSMGEIIQFPGGIAAA